MGGAMGIGAGHGLGGVMGMHSMGMVGAMHPGVVAPHGFAAMPHAAFSHPAFPHHGFFHHHNRFNRFAYGGGGDYFYAGYNDCWRRVWTAYGPQWVNLCADYGY